MDVLETVESMLQAELDDALRRQEERRIAYEYIRGHVSHERSGLEDADRLERASLAEIAARNAAWRALDRLTEFRKTGVIPPDLLESSLGESFPVARRAHC